MSNPKQQQALPEKQQVRIFCYGDSLTAGTSPPLDNTFPYGVHLESSLVHHFGTSGGNEETLPNITPVVRWKGLPGWTASTMVEYADDESFGLRASLRRVQNPSVSLAIILAGTNDLGYEISSSGGGGAKKVCHSVIGLHKIAHEEGVSTMAVSIPPSGWQSASTEGKKIAMDANEMLRSWCTENKDKVTFVEFPFGWNGGGDNDDLWSYDGLHFSPEGYRALGEGLAPFVSDIVLANSEKISGA
eukprot:CAMPEP_0195542704 /NCGR_PEP_ID=MMETSP0794_2-20130614/51739_1 /TAXON_ID=515487 /ORGANISM="Stephanopyxis turris, Strain CCMP 815" /LENGTH=244 /DNA_ID=CAMNT_0040676841 /DNA_START=180 /DNA_END=914 /DNA_ORIENTATION=+